MVKNASDHDNAMRDIRVSAHASIEMHGLPNKIGRVKNAPDFDSARCDIRVTAHAVLKCTDYPIKSVGLRMHRNIIVQGVTFTPYPIKSVGSRMHRTRQYKVRY